MSSIFKLTSRKFIVAGGALLALFNAGESPWRLGVIAAVAALYIFAEAYLDARGLAPLARDVASTVKKGLEAGEAVTTEGAAEPPTTTFVQPPAKATLLPPVPEVFPR